MDAQQQARFAEKFNGDEAFRSAVLADPHHAIMTEFGVKLPFSLKVERSEEGYRLLPVENSEEELSEDQLDAVVGGAFFSWGAVSNWFSNTFFRGGSSMISPNVANIVANNTSRIVAGNTSR